MSKLLTALVAVFVLSGCVSLEDRAAAEMFYTQEEGLRGDCISPVAHNEFYYAYEAWSQGDFRGSRRHAERARLFMQDCDK